MIRYNITNNTAVGGRAGTLKYKPFSLDYILPVKYVSNWSAHWKTYAKYWYGEELNKNKIPIPSKPHEYAELAYPNHMIPLNKTGYPMDGANMTCTYHTTPVISS